MNATADALMSVFGMKRVKARKCAQCRQEFMPFRPMQKACSTECAILISSRKSQKADKLAKAEERKAIKARKEKIKTRSDYMKEAQVAFNSYIRARDTGKQCICCGADLVVEAVGGGFDCGHYRSVGSAPHLRFDERNAHGQRKQCNRYGGGRAVDYRIGLIARIGSEAVAAIEADQEPRKWSIDDLKAIKATYRAKLKALRAGK